MEMRYHTCGHPIGVRASPQHGDLAPIFFDGTGDLDTSSIAICPRCGSPLTLESLHPQPVSVAVTIALWSALWPTLQQQIEAQLAQITSDAPSFYPYHAEHTLTDFVTALQRVAELTAQLEHHGHSDTTTP